MPSGRSIMINRDEDYENKNNLNESYKMKGS